MIRPVGKVNTPEPFEQAAEDTAEPIANPCPSLERRNEARDLDWRPEFLFIEMDYGDGPRTGRAHPAGAHCLSAKLLDVSEGGLGLEMLIPPILNSVVSVSVQLHGRAACFELKGRARVSNCSYRDDETYRIGLAFQDVERRDLYCAHESDFAPIED